MYGFPLYFTYIGPNLQGVNAKEFSTAHRLFGIMNFLEILNQKAALFSGMSDLIFKSEIDKTHPLGPP